MPNTWYFKGGARVGFVFYTFPLVHLDICSEKIAIRVFFNRQYIFTQTQIISIKKISENSILFEHSVKDYPKKITFIVDRPDPIIGAIEESGFSPSGIKRCSLVEDEGFPFYWSSLIGAIFMWNVSYALSDFLLSRDRELYKVFPLHVITVFSTFLVLLLLKKSFF